MLRIYRRAASTIQEVDCASAGPGGTASASLEAVRGSNYLVLVGRRPGTADGSFKLTAELFLPPPNDDRSSAQVVKLPGSVHGTTLGATADESDSDSAGSSVASSGTELRAAATGGFCFASPQLGSSTRRLSSSNASVRGHERVTCGADRPPRPRDRRLWVSEGRDLSDRDWTRPERRSRDVPARHVHLRAGGEISRPGSSSHVAASAPPSTVSLT